MSRSGPLLRRAWLLIGGALFCAPALAASEAEPGERLVDECQTRSVYCEAFIAASIEAHTLLNQYVLMVAGHQLSCLPDDLEVETVRQLVVDHAKRRPKDRVYSGGTYVSIVLEKAYSCGR